jgi:membrane protein
MRRSGIWPLIKLSVLSWRQDHASSMGAALAYYTLFSIAPVLVIVIAVAGFFFGAEAARGEIVTQLRGLLGDDGATAVQGLLESASQPEEGLFATISSIALLLLGATTVFAELQSDLDRIWRAEAVKSIGGVWGFLRGRVLSFGMVLALAFLLLVSLVLSAALAALGNVWGGWLEGLAVLLEGLNFVASFAVTMGLFALIYKLLPRVDIAWQDVWIGAAVTAILFAIGKFLIGLYIGRSGIASGFGAAGSFVVLLVWVYYSTQIFLLGAEFTWVYAHEHGSRRGKPRPGAAKATPPTTRDTHDDAQPVRTPVTAERQMPAREAPKGVVR